MASDFFDFKQFRVYHNRCAMKVGTDGVLLGALVQVEEDCGDILDIGTGSGLVALMMAQRSRAQIVGIELEEEAASQAAFNFSESPWATRLHALHMPVQEYAAKSQKKFSYILSNPPYFDSQSNVEIEDDSRSRARHNVNLSFAELAHAVHLLLEPKGCFYVILPVEESIQFEEEARVYGLFRQRKTDIFPKPGKPVNRVIGVYGFEKTDGQSDSFYIRDAHNQFSEEYIAATKDFYLRIEK